ncbi:cysteine desulfurase [Acetatifactor muris]|jgi:cysteine desulfurase|uniref:Cysteine desulfurase n=1 Tax=Acetatifactor muris TaxID=879566 RepID=A0A2K4ZNS1_9FIRM|nr:cysteine desulfurase family protein [Acetatifactor muris]MCI8801565.1 cysteine desulfurase [Lachnospiraceae bacterium]MCR2050523.1 cysteine desulfurase [Acetatifactor muris]SOY32095.1 Cysteine desulfurase [Acetatifactor muris]
MDRIYADCAATTPISESALQVMTECMRIHYGNPSSAHQNGREAARILEEARGKIAACIGAEPEEIYFTSGGTEADNQAILTAAMYGKLIGKRHMIFSQVEHHAVLNCIPALEKAGFEITLLGVDMAGNVSIKELKAACRKDTILAAVMYVNNEVGTVEPAAEIGQLCRERDILFHIDGVAAAGHIPVQVKELGADMFSLSAHKFHGPRGIGVLYVDKRIPVANLMFGGSQERDKRPGTQNVPGAAAMARALCDSVAALEEQTRKMERLRERLLCGLKDVEGMWLNGNPESRVPGIINLGFEGVSGEALMLLLDLNGISVSTGAACNTESVEPSHVLTAMGLSPERARSCIRISLSVCNTEEEIDTICRAVSEAVERART